MLEEFLRRLIFTLFLATALISCGKKANNATSGDSRIEPIEKLPELSHFISSQKVYCNDFFSCPESIAKVVVLDKGNVNYCTGTLINSNQIITSASCLSRGMQVKDLDCSNSVFFIFPKTLFKPAETLRCKRIVHSDITTSKDAALTRQDLVLFELHSQVLRGPSYPSERGFEPSEDFQTYVSNYVDEHKSVITKKTCSPVFNSYANPFSETEKSPYVTMSGCELSEGNRGGAILDSKGELRGVLSSNLDSRIKSYVEAKKLVKDKISELSFASNLSCLPENLNQGLRDKECDKALTNFLLEKKRAEILSQDGIHESMMNKIIEELEAPKKYFIYKYFFNFNPKTRVYEISMGKPKCLLEVDKWANEYYRMSRYRTYASLNYKVPKYQFKLMLDKNLKPYSSFNYSESKSFKVEFNPKDAVKYRSTAVSISELSESGDLVPIMDYSDVDSHCE